MENPNQKTLKLPQLTCACCGGDAGAYRQHPNRDDGYGVCAACVSWMKGRGTSTDEITDLYGLPGVNFEAPMHAVYGRRYAVLAEFPATDIGRGNANKFMSENEGAALLAEVNGRLVLAHKDDRGIV